MELTDKPKQPLAALLQNFSEIRTVKDAIQSQTKQISIIKAEAGQETVIDLLVLFITDLVNFVNVGKSMNESQIQATAQYILEDFWHLKIADYKLFCDKFKKGVYGKLYDRLDGQIIIEALSQYDFERMETASMLKPKVTEPETELKLSPGQTDEPFIYKKVRPDYVYATSIKDLSPVQKMHNRWLDSFAKIWDKQGGRPGKRFIKRFGRMMDANEFLEKKQAQYARLVESGLIKAL